MSEIDIQENVDDMPLLVIQDPISTRSHSKAKWLTFSMFLPEKYMFTQVYFDIA